MAGQSGLAKAITVLVAILLVSLGLCGMNFMAVMGIQGAGMSPAHRQTFGVWLLRLGVLEIVGIVGSVLGLMVVGVVALVGGIGGGKDEGE